MSKVCFVIVTAVMFGSFSKLLAEVKSRSHIEILG